ncbi:hypothetical protein FGIG_06721 [Fasciola gigantica]|uniref:Uncharacterized protein n=1 Tax=Fasciola gigantica TaxID=46835 RepID=A0A504Z289_FASGI|nr:hypothetical protein FGIG_06721 [Fasciola gigantica]
MALRALNSNGQMGPIWPQIPLVARSSLPAPLIRRRLSPSSESSYSSHSSTRSHSRRRSRRRHSRIRHYSSKDSSCYSSSSGRSTSCSRSSTRSRSYRRGDRRRPRRRSSSSPRLSSHYGYSRRFPTSQRGNHNHSRRYRSGSYSRSCSSRSRSRSVTRKSCTNNNNVVKSCSNHLPLPSVRSSHRSLSSGSEGEVSDFVEEDFEPCQRVARVSKDRSRPDESDGSHSSHPDDVDIPDSLVIQANLIRSPPTSGGSFYSASTSSSRSSRRIFRNERSIDHRRSPPHTPSSSSSAVSSRNTKRSGPLSRSWSSDA